MDTVVQPISVCDLSRQTEVDLSEENWIVWVADVQQLSGLILCSTTIKSEENWIVWVADVQQLSGLILCSTTIMVTSSSHVSCVMCTVILDALSVDGERCERLLPSSDHS